MTCIEAQKKMTQFIHEKLNKKELEDFLIHIRSCESCREDLEIYYTLFASIKLLDEDKNKGENNAVDFERKLRRAEELVHKDKLLKLYKRMAILAIILLVALYL